MNQVEAEEKIQLKLFEKQQADGELADYVEANHANGKARSAASKDKVLTKIKAEAVERPKLRENTFVFEFPDCDKLPGPVLPFDGVCFAYSGKREEYLYENLDIGVDCDSRVALVGPNGCGKSTLLKLMAGELRPTAGDVKPHPALSIGRYNQHSAEQLDPEKTVFAFFKSTYPNSPTFKRTDEFWRAWLDRFGLTTKMQNTKIGCLSDGQKSRIVFAMINMRNPNLLLLDEPTNHLDVDAIDGLANAIKKFNGASSSSHTTSGSSTKSPIRSGCARTKESPSGPGASESTSPRSRPRGGPRPSRARRAGGGGSRVRIP